MTYFYRVNRSLQESCAKFNRKPTFSVPTSKRKYVMKRTMGIRPTELQV